MGYSWFVCRKSISAGKPRNPTTRLASKSLNPTRLLLGDDLRGLSRRRKPGQRGSGDAAVFDDEIFPPPTRNSATSISRQSQREGIVNEVGPKTPRLRLDPVDYEKLRQQVLRRDGWRCQSCGSMRNLEVHHRRFRSRSGSDSETNLITLCAACHGLVHRAR